MAAFSLVQGQAQQLAEHPERIIPIVNTLMQHCPNGDAESYVLGKGVANTVREILRIGMIKNTPHAHTNHAQLMQASQRIAPIAFGLQQLLNRYPDAGFFRTTVPLPSGGQDDILISRNVVASIRHLLSGINDSLVNQAAPNLGQNLNIDDILGELAAAAAHQQNHQIVQLPAEFEGAISGAIAQGLQFGHTRAAQAEKNKPYSKLLIGGCVIATAAVVYGVYKFFFAKEKKQKQPDEAIA